MGQYDLPNFCDLAHKIFRQKWLFIDFDVLNFANEANCHKKRMPLGLVYHVRALG